MGSRAIHVCACEVCVCVCIQCSILANCLPALCMYSCFDVCYLPQCMNEGVQVMACVAGGVRVLLCYS